MYPANFVAARNLYPTYAGMDSLGLGATAPISPPASGDGALSTKTLQADVGNAAAVGAKAHPVPWWVTLAVLLVALMYFAQRFDGEGSYSNLRLSFYNIITITLASVIGITLFKVTFTKFPVPGLSTVILAV
jgi:hypothetical protein